MNDASKQLGPNSTNSLLVVALMGLSAILAYQTWAGGASTTGGNANYSPREVTPTAEPGATEQATIDVFQQTSPSVVFIRTQGFQPVLFGGVQEKELSSGTGFVWDEQGHIVTNLHVIKEVLVSKNTALQVQFADKSVADATFIGGVQEHDIAVLKVDASPEQLRPILLGTSDDLQVGQSVLAIGNPFGFDQTLSTGVIGGLNRIVGKESGQDTLNGLIQTDAAINPGNSGGPLLDSSGRLIGVNTAIVSPTGAYAGLGFAVPANSVVKSVDMVLTESTGERKPILGISVLAPDQVAEWGIPDEINERGLFIGQVFPNGPASATDLRGTRQSGYRVYLGDQITALNDVPIATVEQLHAELEKYSPGDVVTVSAYRENQLGNVEVKLEARTLLFK